MENPLDDLVDPTGAPPDAVWKGVGIGAGMLGALVARSMIRRATSVEDSERQRPGAVERILWTALLGVGASLGRLAAQRLVAAAWTRRQSRAL